MTWNRRKVIHRDKEYVDHIWDEHPHWSLEEGRNHEAARIGLIWCLLHRGVEVDFARTLAEAKRLAEKYEREGLPGEARGREATD